jgi:glycine cleavage system H protein
MIMNEKLYVKSHEWVEFSDEKTAKIGISDYAQHELGDIVFINLPEPGVTVTEGVSFADVESVKAVSDVYAPVSGIVKSVNTFLLDNPELINVDAENNWLIEVESISSTEALMNKAEYAAFIKSQNTR